MNSEVSNSLGQNLIFLACVPRSGSTLLQRVLSTHSEVASASEPWIMLHPVYAMRDSGITADYDHSLAYLGLNEFLSLVPERVDLYVEAIRKMGLHLYEEVQKKFNKKYFLDKTPRYYLILDELLKIFPLAHIIILIRNPLAVLASTLSTWFQCDPARLLNSQNYNDLINGFRIIAKNISRKIDFCFVRYESFVSSPRDATQKLCNQLGISYESQMIIYDNTSVVPSALGDSTKINLYNKPVDFHKDDWINFFNSNDISYFGKFFLDSLGPDVVNALGYDYIELIKNLSKNEKLYWSCGYSTKNVSSIKDKINGIKTKNIVVATSLAPNNHAVQKIATDSWRNNGFDVISLNSEKEYLEIKKLYPDVKVVRVAEDSEYIFGKPYVFLDDILLELRNMNPDICGIINSDIVIPQSSKLLEMLIAEMESKCLIYGSRVEVKNLKELDGKFYNNGFDMFFFSPDEIANIPKSLSSIGVTWWDYWFPVAAALSGLKLKKIGLPFGFHLSHETRWSEEQWKFMGLHIAQAIWNMRVNANANLFENPELLKLDIIIRSSANYILSNKITDKHDKIHASYFNLETFAKALLEFLKSESKTIFLKQENCCINTKNNLIERLNIEAQNELKKNNPKAALMSLMNALKIDQNHSDTLCNLGVVASKEGDVGKSIFYFKLCLEKNPYHSFATLNLGKVLIGIGQEDLAKKLFAIHLHEYPGDLEIGKALFNIENNMKIN